MPSPRRRYAPRSQRRGSAPPVDTSFSPQKPCHCEERSDVAIRPPPRAASPYYVSVGRGALTLPPFLHRTFLLRVGATLAVAHPIRTALPNHVIANQRARWCGERIERCRWQKKRDERVAAVKILSGRRKAARKFWAPQQGHPYPPRTAHHSGRRGRRLPTVVAANRGTSSKPARFIRRWRRFADFPDAPPMTRRTSAAQGKRIPTSLRSSE